MLTTVCCLEEVSALISKLKWFRFSNFSVMIKFKIYVGWAGIAERPLNKWVSPRISLFAIDPVDGQVQLVICPLRALIRFWSFRQKVFIPAKLLIFYGLVTFLVSLTQYLIFYPGVPMYLRPTNRFYQS